MYALCRTQHSCYSNSTDIIMGTKGTCYLGNCRIDGENAWQYPGPHNNPYIAEQKALIDSVRSGKPINSGYHMNDSTMIGVLGQLAVYTGKATKWEDAHQADVEFKPRPEDSTFETPPPTLPDAAGNYPLPKPGITKPEEL